MTFSPTSAHVTPVCRERCAPLPDAKLRRSAARRKGAAGEAGRQDPRVSPLRASRVLRDLLAQNPDVERFTVQEIVEHIKHGGPATCLMLFSIPAIVPIPGTSDLIGPPVMAVSSSFVGNRPVCLPLAILQRSIPRRALALAIHAVLPVLERAEKLTRKRWSWLCTPAAHRVIGILVFLLALPLTFPFLGFGLPHATSLFTIALGMIEKDGVAIALGVTAGIASLVFLTAKGLTPHALARKAADWLQHFVRKLTAVRSVVVMILKRASRWLSVKLLTGPSKTTKNAAKRTTVRVTPDVRRLSAASQSGLQTKSRLASMVSV